MAVSEQVSDLFDRLCARAGARTAVRGASDDLSYRDLLSWSQACTRSIEPLARRPGERVALLLPNSAAFVAAFYGIARVGGVVAPLSPLYRSQELEYFLADLDASVLITQPSLGPVALEVLHRLARPPALVEMSPACESRLVRPGLATERHIPRSDPLPLLQLYTSGSIGTPKKVVRTHTGLLSELWALQRVFNTGETDRFLGAAPFSHVNGLVRTMMSAMHTGAMLYPVEEFHRRQILDLITHARITVFGGVPQMFAILSQTPERGQVDLSSLRVLFSSSAPLLPSDNRLFHARYGRFVRQLYGSTETGTISFNRDPRPEACLGSVGIPLEEVRVEILDARGRRAAVGEEGEIAVASPFAATGYPDNPAATRESFRGAFYRTGDRGRMNAEGSLTITGRRSLLINRGGFKVNPYEVEEAIAQHPGVREVAVFGEPGPHGDDIVCSCIVASGGCTAEEIVFHCRSRLASYKIPTRIEFRDALPKSPTGKLLRALL